MVPADELPEDLRPQSAGAAFFSRVDSASYAVSDVSRVV